MTLERVIEHLANRTTARERVSYHIVESYVLKEDPVPYGSLNLPESDIYDKDHRALPPAEDMVLVAWYENAAQLELAQAQDGFVYVRLGAAGRRTPCASESGRRPARRDADTWRCRRTRIP